MDESIISLNDILDNPSRVLEVKGIGNIMVRDPTTKDRLEARDQAKKDPRWESMSQEERLGLIQDLIAIKMMVEPKVTIDDYYNANSVKLMNIIDAIVIDYTKRFQSLTKKREKEIRDFLELLREGNPGSSTTS